ncbi:MAG: hypothetical protein KDC61_07430, partial [Saprospiraceae bacterium]|nr:hypothetical protein [Saprospiraceae bacterium]
MSFGEVNNLRKSGNLQDAFAMAQADMNADPGNIWNKRSMGWVYFDQLKAASQVEQFEAFEQILCSIAELGLPVEEDMFWEQVCWQAGKMAFAIQKTEPVDFSKLDHLFHCIVTLPFHKPSESYSFLLKAFQKSSKVWWQYTAFVEWWGLEHLRQEDYLAEEM